VEVFLFPDASASAGADQKVIKLSVVVAVIEDALSLLLVTARPTTLLDVAF